MDKIAAEFIAALPEPRVILGLRLLPLSLGRYRLLRRFNCPFVEEEQKEIAVDILTKELFFSLLICGLPCAEFKKLLFHVEQLEAEAQRFGEIAGKIISTTEHFSILDSINNFKEYCAEATRMPWHVVPRDGNQAVSVSHWSHSMSVTLRARVGWTQEKIDEEPMQEAMSDFFKYLESEGVVSLMTHEQFAEIEKMGESNALAFIAHFEAMEKLEKQYGPQS